MANKKADPGQPKRKRGRPRKYFNDEEWKRVLIGYQRGFTQEQIAQYVGCCVETLVKCMDENPKMKTQAEQQRMVACSQVVGELMNRGIGGRSDAALIFLAKVWLGWTDRNHVVQEHKGEIKTTSTEPAKVELNVMYEDPIEEMGEQIDENTGEVVETFVGDEDETG